MWPPLVELGFRACPFSRASSKGQFGSALKRVIKNRNEPQM